MTATGLCINPAIRQLRCSLSGNAVDAEGFARPIGLCSCCPAPGKPVIVDYDADALRQAVKDRPPFGCDGPALVAALRKMRDKGQVAAGEKVLLLFTATHLIPLGQRVP